ncbi:LicD family-domain-containing protein [Xylariaceae sp. FL0662B]|nr:LicD family-domain-containing protein [Xylariaceae sp. FL0662B]
MAAMDIYHMNPAYPSVVGRRFVVPLDSNMHTLRLFLLTLVLSSTTITAVDQPPHRHPTVALHKKPGKPKEGKYFHEPGGSLELGHYDRRYFNGTVAYAEHRAALRLLIRSYLSTFQDLGIETWLAHGSLLGWWWNGRILPWDYDLDVQVTATTLERLALYFNGTLHDYHLQEDHNNAGDYDDGGGQGSGAGGEKEATKTYLLDINPHHADAGRGNGANVIDARWIDVSNGMFIDITALAERDPVGAPGVWSCKNAHRYRTMDLYPMRRSQFEGAPATVPYAFDRILTDEYGTKSLSATEWAG